MNKRNGLLIICLLISALALYAQEEGSSSDTSSNKSAAQTSSSQGEKSAATTEEATSSPEGFVTPREEVKEKPAPAPAAPRVVFNPKSQKDPTLSPDDILLLEYREKQRLAAEEAERQRKLAEERKRLEEEERRRRLELERIKDPTREVRNKFKVGGVIGQEVFIGDKIYTIGNTIFGARIVEVHADYVVFSYKGHRFRKNVQL